MVSHELKCIFIHIPKCGGTSVEVALGHHDRDKVFGNIDHRSVRMIEPVDSMKSISSIENVGEIARRVRYQYLIKHQNTRNIETVTPEQYREYFKFTIVRNPWDRAYSWYKNVVRGEQNRRRLNIPPSTSFKDFLQAQVGNDALRPQIRWLKNFAGKIELDHIGRFENLEDEFRTICSHLKVESKGLPHYRKGSGESYVDSYDTKMISLIADFYRTEIELFGYSFGK
jgi:hypothetical protein